MIFCLGDGRCESKGEGYQKSNRIFNINVPHDEYVKVKNTLKFKILLTEWIWGNAMTDEEKRGHEEWAKAGGYLKRWTYEEAWANYWNKATQEDKDVILKIPQFNAEIFKKITGIDVAQKPSLKGKVVSVELDGQKYSAIIQ